MNPTFQEEIPKEYLCPITGEIMTDPVVAADDLTYQRENIEEWFRRGNENSFITGEKLCSFSLYKNCFAKIKIQEYKKKRLEAKFQFLGGNKSDLNIYIK